VNELLSGINNTLKTHLKRQNEIMQQMLDIMPRPEHKFSRVLETLVLVAGVLGILNAADIVRHWIVGG
jgi:glycerol dehydrogenase-like iron-containing ADH family enzyme